MDIELSHKQVLWVHTELQLKKQDQGSLSKAQSVIGTGFIPRAASSGWAATS